MSDKYKDGIIFETTDPNNNIISLSEDTWENHVIKRHSYMRSHDDAVKKVITNPKSVHPSNAITPTRIYYDMHGIPELTYIGDLLKVAVNIDNGSVKTAVVTRKITEDNPLYERKNGD